MVAIGALVLAGLRLAWTVATWPDVAALRTRNPDTTAFIERYRRQEREAGRTGDVQWSWVPASRISPWLKKAVVVAEDVEFFSHGGFSSHETREALRRAIDRRQAPRGASTITQQLAKNLWLSPRRSLTRKLREAALTARLERTLSKERILELYLNVVEFGPGVYGAEAGARHYFGKPASGLISREAAELAAGLPKPSTWHPGSESPAYARRVARILDLMRRIDFLDRRLGLELPPVRPDEVAPPDVDTSRASAVRPPPPRTAA